MTVPGGSKMVVGFERNAFRCRGEILARTMAVTEILYP